MILLDSKKESWGYQQIIKGNSVTEGGRRWGGGRLKRQGGMLYFISPATYPGTLTHLQSDSDH